MEQNKDAEKPDSTPEEMLRSLGHAFGATQLGITITDPNRRILYANAAEARMHGYAVDELIGMDSRIFAPREHWTTLTPDQVRQFRSWRRESINVKKDGTPFPVYLTSDIIIGQEGDPIGIVTTCKDISQQKQAEHALWESELRFRSVAQTATDAIILADSAGNILFWNTAAERIFGYTEAEIIYEPLLTIIPERYREAHLAGLQRLRETGESRTVGRTMEVAGLRKDGTECPVEISIGGWHVDNEFFYSAALRDISRRKRYEDELSRHRDQLEALVQSRTSELEETNRKLQNEIQERQRAEEALAKLAFHDGLTGLPNRVLFEDRLTQAFHRARRRREYHFAVLYLDLDRFKDINDLRGHLAGDQVLVSVAHTLESCLRPEDTVARIGGDEFAVLLDDVQNAEYVTRVAERIQTEMDRIEAGASIGIALSEGESRSPQDLIHAADEAMYRAKRERRSRK